MKGFIVIALTFSLFALPVAVQARGSACARGTGTYSTAGTGCARVRGTGTTQATGRGIFYAPGNSCTTAAGRGSKATFNVNGHRGTLYMGTGTVMSTGTVTGCRARGQGTMNAAGTGCVTTHGTGSYRVK
jgi:hypothetical protein